MSAAIGQPHNARGLAKPGDPYFTDGDIEVSKLVAGCSAEGTAPQALPPPPRIAAKNAVFSWLTSLWRAFR